MNGRRTWLLRAMSAAGAAWAAGDARAAAPERTAEAVVADPVRRGRPMRFPRDHGAHLGSRIEWWYATGWLRPEAARADERVGFQVTFFRSSTGLAAGLPGRLAPRHLLFAHAAITDPGSRRHVHADRIARWSGEDLPGLQAWASVRDTDLRLGGWRWQRADADAGSRHALLCGGDELRIELELQSRLPPLLQGDQGFSRKGPQEQQASHYLSETQVRVRGQLQAGNRRLAGEGLAWIDHEWSDELLHPDAVGWDWIGINLDDGRSLTAFQLRRADGTPLWAGGSLREADGHARSFGPADLRFTPGRTWTSPSSQARYPVEWTVQTPAGTWTVRSLLDAQELDGRRSTGAVYWEGLSACLDAQGRPAGHGYLEMTGYGDRLRL